MVFRQIAACGLSHPFLAAVVSFLTCYTDLSTGGLRVTALADLLRGLADGQHRAAWFPVPAVDRSSEVTHGRSLEGVGAAQHSHSTRARGADVEKH